MWLKLKILLTYFMVLGLKFVKFLLKINNLICQFFLSCNCGIVVITFFLRSVFMVIPVVFLCTWVNFSMNILHFLRFFFIEPLMFVDILCGVFFIVHFSEIINVQLTDERWEVRMLEIFWQDELRKSRRIHNYEWRLFWSPADILRGLILLLYIILHWAYVLTLPKRMRFCFAFFPLFYSLTNLKYYIRP